MYISFRNHKIRCCKIGMELLSRFPPHALDEQAVPAYVEGFFFSRWLFWRRLAYCHNYIQRFKSGACLDFGCGVGIMLPLLQTRFSTVYAVDKMIEYTQQFIELWETNHCEFFQAVQLSDSLDTAQIPENSLDLVLALDVFEHMYTEELQCLLARIALLMKTNGILVVAGPTENLFYRLGRRIVGFSGDYHQQNIVDIKREISNIFSVKVVKRLIFPLDFFIILQAIKL